MIPDADLGSALQATRVSTPSHASAASIVEQQEKTFEEAELRVDELREQGFRVEIESEPPEVFVSGGYSTTARIEQTVRFRLVPL